MRRKIAIAVALMTWACETDRTPETQPDTSEIGSRPEVTDQRPAVVFLGTSLTAGLGVSEGQSFPAIVGGKLDSLGVSLRVVNAGESGGTSAGGLRRIDLLLEEYEVAVLVLELGANDGLRGLDIDAMRSNLESIVAKTQMAFPESEIVIAGMEAPPNLGEPYISEFRRVFSELAEEYDARLIPFLLDGVGGVPEMNQSDGIHPNVEGHRRVAENVWDVMEPLVRRRMQEPVG